MKIDRLLGITIYLLNHKRVTAQTLAERFEVSIRTILRDVNTLSLAGIPVTTIYGAEGGYEILDTFKMERQIAGETDYSYIVAALQGLATAYDNKEINETLEKMQAVGNVNQTNMVLDFGVVNENKFTNEKLLIIQKAINESHTVSFEYTNSENGRKEFEVEPVATMYKWYNWYLLCYYPKYQDYRIFKLVRMDNLFITERKNSMYHNVEDAKIKWEQAVDSREIMNIKLYCNSEIRAKCLEYLNGRVEQELENGDFIYRFSVPANEQFWYGTLLSFESLAKVIEPVQLIEKIRSTCQKVLKQYEKV